MTNAQIGTLDNHIKLAERLIDHIAKWGYPGDSIQVLIDHARATEHPLPYAGEEIGIDELKGVYRAKYPYSVEWSETRLTVELLHKMGIKLVWQS